MIELINPVHRHVNAKTLEKTVEEIAGEMRLLGRFQSG